MRPTPGTELATGLDRWSPELRRAVMVARPEFFAWPAEAQLRYRVKLPDDDREDIVAALLREHGERRPAALAKLESHGRVPLGLQNRINEWLQPLKGIGEDAFALNEHFAAGSSILDFETLLDYDRDDHAFQQVAKQRDFEGYQPEPYTGALHGTWARVLVDGRLCYVTLTEELQHRVWEEQFRRRSELGQLFCEQRHGVCFLDDHPWEYQDPDERCLLVVFSDPDALTAVRFTSFLRDCRGIERPLAELRALQAREAERMRDFVAAQHEDLVKNFDPKVVPLRKKLKVMVHPEALRDMGDDGLL